MKSFGHLSTGRQEDHFHPEDVSSFASLQSDRTACSSFSWLDVWCIWICTEVFNGQNTVIMGQYVLWWLLTSGCFCDNGSGLNGRGSSPCLSIRKYRGGRGGGLLWWGFQVYLSWQDHFCAITLTIVPSCIACKPASQACLETLNKSFFLI